MKVTMKAIAGLSLALVLLVGAGLAKAGDLRFENPVLYAELRDQVLLPMFQAMGSGDLQTIKRYMTSQTYEQYRVLFEQNKHYSQFLRNYYAGATFDVRQIVTADSDFVADVLIHWPSGQTSIMKLHVAPTRSAPGTHTFSSPQSANSEIGSYRVAPEAERRTPLAMPGH